MNENSTIVVRLRVNRRLEDLEGEVLLQSRGMRWEDSTHYLLLGTCFGQPRSRRPPCKPHASKHSAADIGHLFPLCLVKGIDQMQVGIVAGQLAARVLLPTISMANGPVCTD